jgi:PKD repeat protein
MKNGKLIFFILVGIFTVMACTKKDNPIESNPGYEYPVASFYYTGNEGPAPVNVQFTNTSETIVEDKCTYLWTFGNNGPTSNEKNPSYTFNNPTNKPQNVLVSLKVTDLVSNLSQTRSLNLEIQGSEQ